MSKVLGTIEVIALVVCIFFGYKWTIDPSGNYEPWLFLGGLVFIAVEIIRRYGGHYIHKESRLATIIPWVKHWLNRPIILPHQQQNWWHMGKTGDQKPGMQIVTYWYVTNTTDKPVNILNAYIKKPLTQGLVLIKDVHSDYHGSYPIPPNTTTDLQADFWIAPPIGKEGKDLTVDIIFVDQYGQKRKLKHTVIPSDKRKATDPKKLEEEAVYKLEHDVEKQVAAVLKDEINRYKKYGRSSGQLGSVYATHQGRKITSIYQDGWTSSRAGERQEIVIDPENSQVTTENGDSLVGYYNDLKEGADKELFINSLISRLDREKEYYCVSYLIIYILFRIGRLSDGLVAACIGLEVKPTLMDIILRRKPTEKLLEPHQRYGYSDTLGMINGLLRYEHQSFSNDELDNVEEFIANTDGHTFQIGEKINSIRSFRVTHNKTLQPTPKSGAAEL
ncbi:MAG: hypothetical protein KZQ75_00740 [Candidatus Thiodiazotropha sp. (ex Myrtea spinifera)]|nr:hypothetical protein [Candidatus Thiodiazotropha sp. (ex Myrtea spinifera)]